MVKDVTQKIKCKHKRIQFVQQHINAIESHESDHQTERVKKYITVLPPFFEAFDTRTSQKCAIGGLLYWKNENDRFMIRSNMKIDDVFLIIL